MLSFFLTFILLQLISFSQASISLFQLCEGQSATLACQSNQNIKIIYANFGGPVPNTCSASNPADATCKMAASSAKVIELCDNKTSCTLHASNTVFGEPCAGKNKTLTVNYYCLEKPRPGSNVFYVLGEGCDSPYPGGVCLNSRCEMLINDVPIKNFIGTLALHIATVDMATLKVLEIKNFNTHGSASDVTAMITWIDNLRDGTFLMLCNIDEATSAMTSAAWTKLATLGVTNPYKTYRSSHALIAFKGTSVINIKKYNTTERGALPAIVSITIVKAPEIFQVKLPGNEMVKIAWNYTRDEGETITITSKLAATANTNLQTANVDAALNSTTIGPLTKNAMTVVQSTYGISNATHYFLKVEFYVIPSYVTQGTLGCTPGVYKVILETNPNSNTMTYASSLWENTETLNEMDTMSVAFSGDTVKTSEYSTSTFKRMCVGMKMINTAIYRFIEVPSPDERKTFLQMMKEGANTAASKAKWLELMPQSNRNILQQNCNLEGFKKNRQWHRTRFGILSNNENDCNTCDSSLGFGFQTGGTGGHQTHPKRETLKAHGYILITSSVNGGWTAWTSWSKCNVTCGSGIQLRNRSCSNPSRSIDGVMCDGEANSNKSCHFDCPPAPKNLRGITQVQKLTLQWDLIPASSLTEVFSPIQHYIVNLKTENGGYTTSRTMSSTATTVPIYSLQIYTKYCFTVHVRLLSGVEGNISTSYCLYTEESTPIGPPNDFTGFNTSAWCLNFTWSPIPNNLARGVITGYFIYLAEYGSNQNTKYTIPATYSTRICHLKPFKSYQATIEGFTKFGTGGGQAMTSAINVKTDENVPVQAPTVSSVRNLTSTSIRVKWQKLDAIHWDGYPLGYIIYYRLKSPANSLTSAIDINSWLTNSYDITNLEIYREYIVWMTAYTSKGNGINGSAVSGWTDESLPSRGPTSVWAQNSSSFSLVVHWDSLDPIYRLGVLLSYRVFYKNLKTEVMKYIDVSANAIMGTINDLEPYTNHSVKVSAFNIKGFGPNSSLAYAFTDEYVPARAPDDFKGNNISSSEIFISWSPIPKQYHVGILLGFTILWRKTMEPFSSWKITTLNDSTTYSTTERNLSAYTNYTFKIAGFTSKGNGNFSSEIIIISGEDAPRNPPEKLNITVNSSSALLITWDPPSSGIPGIIRGYTISYIPMYTKDDFRSHLLVRKRRKRRAIISTPLQLTVINITIGPNAHSLLLNGLHGNTNYSIKILAFTIYDGMWSKTIYITTPEAIPGMSPMNVTATATSYHSVMVTWKHVPPAYAHGYINSYIVFYQQGNHSNVTSYNESQIPERTYLEITHLGIFEWHSFQVVAVTSAGIGVKSEVVHARTKEWIPIKAPERVNATSYYSPFQINVTWLPLEYEYWKGHPLNYQLKVYVVAVGGEKVQSSKEYTFLTHFTQTKFDFVQGQPFTRYAIEIRAQTAIGLGPASTRILADTCNIGRDEFSTSWMIYAPFASIGKSNAMPNGIIPHILQTALQECQGKCATLKNTTKINFETDGTGSPSIKSSYKELNDKMSVSTDFTFPSIKKQFENEDFQFIKLLNVPGAAYIKREKTAAVVGKNIVSATKNIAGEILIFIVFCWLFGVLIWLLETWMRAGTFETNPLRGSFEGFYWAFQTATTVGYGDKYPSSIPGRLLMVIWAFVGLILVSLLSGVLINTLIAEEEVIPVSLGGSQTKPSIGLGAVADTWEYYASMRSSFEFDKLYSNPTKLIEAVASDDVQYGILDQYTATAYQARMSKDHVTVMRILKLEGSIGIYASGHARKLRHCIEKYVEENGQYIAKRLTESIEETAKKVSSEVHQQKMDSLMEDKKPEFYSWESDLMRFYIKLLSSILGAFIIIGCFYELFKFIWKRKKSVKVEPSEQNIELLRFSEPEFGTDKKQAGIFARRRWNILKEILFDSTENDDYKPQLDIEDISHLKMKQQKWKALKEERLGKMHDFMPALVTEGHWQLHLQSIKTFDNKGKGGRNIFGRLYNRVMRNMQLASMNMPGELERETGNMIEEFRHRVEQRLSELDRKHLEILLEKKKQMFKKYGKYKYIKEQDLIEPY